MGANSVSEQTYFGEPLQQIRCDLFAYFSLQQIAVDKPREERSGDAAIGKERVKRRRVLRAVDVVRDVILTLRNGD